VFNLSFERFNLILIGLVGLTIFLSSALQLQLPRTKIHLSVAEAAIFFSILIYGVEIAVILAAIESSYASFAIRRRGLKIKTQTMFINVAFAVIATFIAGWTATHIFPSVLQGNNFDNIPILVGALGVIAASQFFVNSVLLAIYDSLRSEKTFWQVWNENCFNALIMYAVEAAVAGLMVKAFAQINLILFLVTGMIAAVAYITYRRYVDDVRQTAAKAEQAERERAEQAENHIEELRHYIAELEKTGKALRESKENFRRAAFHDALTDLPNRNKFVERLKFLLEKQKHQPDVNFAVLFLDLNRFKTINESLGHATGNRLILHVAKRLANTVREGDLAARFSGDEFAIILNDISGIEDAIEFAEMVSQKIAKPYTLNGRQVFTSVSIGIAVGNSRYNEAEDILRDADIAMYHAKESEKHYAVFDQNMHTRAVTLMQLETDLRYALERNEMITFYQPIIDLQTIELIGFEALMRWQHPQRGLVPPFEFIPVSETTGLIVPLTLWILRDACEQIVKWQQRSPSNKNLIVSVNLSGKHFAQPNLVEQIQKILRETGLKPEHLKLEITESAVMENAETAINMLKQLRDLGIQLSIDDFGTGYSSLSYLHRFPITTLKVDRSFVSTMEEGSENGEIVRTIIALAKALKLSVIAEGIESIHQLHQLRVLGCEYGQGYLFSRPVPVSDIEKILSDKLRWSNIIPSSQLDGIITP
ncbi:MAG TPA: EAL domain-containing protein, partial [Pyrinomonadaceae bacterium]|nr:EAL domain-containing protein [Pyrinomonadaceae bacterium]